MRAWTPLATVSTSGSSGMYPAYPDGAESGACWRCKSGVPWMLATSSAGRAELPAVSGHTATRIFSGNVYGLRDIDLMRDCTSQRTKTQAGGSTGQRRVEVGDG